MNVTETVRVVEMPCTPWLMDEASIQPVKGSWTLPPASLQTLRPEIKALLSCPNCAAIMPFAPLPTDDIDRAHQVGVLTRNVLKCACGLVFTAKLQEWDKRRLYCVVYEVPGTDGVNAKMHKEYMHAESREDAIWSFAQGHKDHAYRLVDAAPVFGYFANENDKDQKTIAVD